MEKYKNKGGGSGIDSYENGTDFIIVMFLGGDEYTYNYEATGAERVEKMKLLAEKGEGLNSFIKKYVKGDYASVKKVKK